jgi:hypothetical protein
VHKEEFYDQTKNNVMSGACSTRGGRERCMKGFEWKT